MGTFEVSSILQRARETLQTAQHGYEDLVAADRTKRLSGLRNVIVFGRSVTWVLQNLRGHVPTFDDWYKPEQEAMAADALMRYFVDARNNLEKQGRLNVGVAATLNISTDDIGKLGPPPPGATMFFVGDRLGGSGWEVQLGDGKTERYYVAIPTSMAEVTQYFHDFPVAKAPELASRSIDELCAMYLGRLDALLGRAEATFLSPAPQSTNHPEPSRPPHLRRVK